jgi:adenosine deaminase CECR1
MTISADNHNLTDPRRRKILKGGLSTLLVAPLVASAKTSTAMSATSAHSGTSAPISFAPAAGKPADITSLFETIKREASPEQLYKFLYLMPKGGDIHHHLGGGFLPSMWYSIATDPKRNGGQRFFTRYRITTMKMHPILNNRGKSHIYQWQTVNEKTYNNISAEFKTDFMLLSDLNNQQRLAWMSSVVLDKKGEGRDEFFEYTWSRLGDLLSSIHVLTELFVENMKLFSAEGVRYMEIQRRVHSYKDERGELIPAQQSDKYWKWRLAQKDAKDTGVEVRWQGVALRFASDAEQQIRDYYKHIYANRDVWVGINMAGREDDNRGYPARFKGVFDEMLRKYPGIGISIHAGEAEKPDNYIRDTLRLGATRIGHGINLLSDEDTLLRMRDSKFLVEINLISNELLEYVPNLDLHPFPIYLRQGIACCLNTDDRGMWDSNFTDEVFVAVQRFNLSWAEIQKTAYNSYDFSFAEESLKRELVYGFKKDLELFENQFSESNWEAILAEVPAVTHGYGRSVLKLKL